MHDRPLDRTDWQPLAQYALALGGLAVIAYFSYQLVRAPHLAAPFKYASLAVIVAIAVAGAGALVQRPPVEAPAGERLYTAAEVAELLNAVRAGGGERVRRAAAEPANCMFCGEGETNVHGLDGTRYHRACFQAAYRERAANATSPR